jgi:hypothetical protein
MASYTEARKLKSKIVNNVSGLSLFIVGSKVEVLYTNTVEAQKRKKFNFGNHFCDLPSGTNTTKASYTALNAIGATV